MRVRVIWTGKTRDAHLRALVEDYLKRLGRFVHCEITELRESAGTDGKAGIEKDSKRISDAVRPGGVTVLLDSSGDEWTSEQLATKVRSWENSGAKEITFVLGGPFGVSPALADLVDARWSFSRLTFTHEMARVLLLEQLYRAYTINQGLPYQK